MKTNEQIIKDINERFFNNDVWLSELRTELSIGDSNFTELRKYILQVRTDTINEIRKEVEKFPTGMFDSTPYKKDLITFLNKLDK